MGGGLNEIWPSVGFFINLCLDYYFCGRLSLHGLAAVNTWVSGVWCGIWFKSCLISYTKANTYADVSVSHANCEAWKLTWKSEYLRPIPVCVLPVRVTRELTYVTKKPFSPVFSVLTDINGCKFSVMTCPWNGITQVLFSRSFGAD